MIVGTLLSTTIVSLRLSRLRHAKDGCQEQPVLSMQRNPNGRLHPSYPERDVIDLYARQLGEGSAGVDFEDKPSLASAYFASIVTMEQDTNNRTMMDHMLF